MGSFDGMASIWDLRELVCLRTVDRFQSLVRTLDFSYDGRLLAGTYPLCVSRPTDPPSAYPQELGLSVAAL